MVVGFEDDMSVLHTRFPDLDLYVDTPSHGFPPSYSIMICLATAEFIESDFLVDVQVAGLRRKLRSTTGRDWIAVVGGTAYRLRTAQEA